MTRVCEHCDRAFGMPEPYPPLCARHYLAHVNQTQSEARTKFLHGTTTHLSERKPMKIGPKTTTSSTRRCGFCCTDAHDQCPGGMLNGNGTDVVLCGCDCLPADQKHRCLVCNARTDVDPQTWNCIDVAGCAAAAEKRLAKQRERLHLSQRTPAPSKVKKDPKKPQPRSCTCGCGGETRGGLFLPGHDSKLLSQTVEGITIGKYNLNDTLDTWRSIGLSVAFQAKLEKRVAASHTNKGDKQWNH